MNKNSKEYQEALQYFGANQLSKFEEEVSLYYKEHKVVKGDKPIVSFWKIYALVITSAFAFYFAQSYQFDESTKSARIQGEKSSEHLFSKEGTFHLPKIGFPSSNQEEAMAIDQNIGEDIEESGDEILTVKSGDTLIVIAARLLVKNNLANNHKNRLKLISELKTMNANIEDSDFIKVGWELKIMKENELRKIFQNL